MLGLVIAGYVRLCQVNTIFDILGQFSLCYV